MDLYTKDGRLSFPENKLIMHKRKKNAPNVVKEAYCPKGCDLIDKENVINGFPGLQIKFKRAETEGVFVFSAIEGDFDKIILSGSLKDGVKDDLFCPHCNTQLEKLVNCNCQPDAEMILIGLTPKLDYNNAIAFCNVTGCTNGTTLQAGTIIKRVGMQENGL